MTPVNRGKIIFCATEDWFFVSHFLPMARAALAMGMDAAVICRVRDHRHQLEAAGLRVLPFESARGSLNPVSLLADARRMAHILRQEKPDIVHAIALRGALAGGLAARRADIRRRVLAITGLGFLGAAGNAKARMLRSAIGAALRSGQTDATTFLFENPDDPPLLGFPAPPHPRISIVPGAGVDPEKLTVQPLPAAGNGLRLAMITRMVWSKGVDIAIDAVQRARAAGADVTLSLYGNPDPDNPRTISEAQLRQWNGLPGVTWHGATRDVNAVWREHHLCCAPSRGGEGLPRTILEAAACGRAILTTDVPGCRTFVRHGVNGLVVAPDNPGALADAIQTCAANPHFVAQAGAASRQILVEGYTEQAVIRIVTDIYARLLAR